MLSPVLDAEKTVSGMKILTDINPYFKFVETNGKKEKTNEIEGYTYTCVAIEKKFEKFSVKIEHSTPLFDNNKNIPSNCEIEFVGLTGFMYVAGTEKFKYIACSFKADDIVLVDE